MTRRGGGAAVAAAYGDAGLPPRAPLGNGAAARAEQANALAALEKRCNVVGFEPRRASAGARREYLRGAAYAAQLLEAAERR